MSGPGAPPEVTGSLGLSVVVPAFNEETRLGPTLARLLAYLHPPRWDAEVIVVDDGSSDRTAEVAASAAKGQSIPVRVLRNAKNAGKGKSVQRGVAVASRALVLFSDADLSTPIEEVEKLVAAIADGADIAIGSRALPDTRIEIRQAFYREAMGKTFNLMARLLTGVAIHDTQCGFKAFRLEVAQELFRALAIPGFGFDVEILAKAQQRGYRISEVPVVWRNSAGSRVDPIRDSLRMARDLFRIRRSLRRLP